MKKRDTNNDRSKDKKTIGIELPFGWCLVRSKDMRKLQLDLIDSKFKAYVRLKRLSNIYKKLMTRK